MEPVYVYMNHIHAYQPKGQKIAEISGVCFISGRLCYSITFPNGETDEIPAFECSQDIDSVYVLGTREQLEKIA